MNSCERSIDAGIDRCMREWTKDIIGYNRRRAEVECENYAGRIRGLQETSWKTGKKMVAVAAECWRAERRRLWRDLV